MFDLTSFQSPRFFQGSLPIVMMFEMPDSLNVLDEAGIQKLQEDLDVCISIKPKQRQANKSVLIKAQERNASSMYRARHILLGLDGQAIEATVPETYKMQQSGPGDTFYSLNNNGKVFFRFGFCVLSVHFILFRYSLPFAHSQAFSRRGRVQPHDIPRLAQQPVAILSSRRSCCGRCRCSQSRPHDGVAPPKTYLSAAARSRGGQTCHPRVWVSPTRGPQKMQLHATAASPGQRFASQSSLPPGLDWNLPFDFPFRYLGFPLLGLCTFGLEKYHSFAATRTKGWLEQ